MSSDLTRAFVRGLAAGLLVLSGAGAHAQSAGDPGTPEEVPFAGVSGDEGPAGPDESGLGEAAGPSDREGTCVCNRILRPVCGLDDTTYPNACVAGCHDVAVAYDGACRPPPVCVCGDQWRPVCGVDGQTYGNACQADCAGVLVGYEGECRPGCTCPAVVDPVCGVDGVTYGNSCEAGCSGVEVDHPGPCTEPAPVD